MNEPRTQQYSLYAAERTIHQGQRFATIEEVRAFVDGIVNEAWWPEYHPKLRFIDVLARDNRTHESVGGYMEHERCGIIEMLKVHWQELPVLHELAHVTAKERFDATGHDPFFAREYLELVYRTLGAERWQELRTAFTKHNIVFDERG